MSLSLGIVRKGSLFTAECPVQKIFDEIADFGVRCPQVGVVAQTHAVAHFAARCPLFTSSSKRWFKATAASSRPGRSYSCQSSAVAWTVIVIVFVIYMCYSSSASSCAAGRAIAPEKVKGKLEVEKLR